MVRNYLKKIALALSFILPLAANSGTHAELKNGKDVIAEMHKKYEGKWWKYLVFKQNTIFYQKGEEVNRQVWHEYVKLPGVLRIDRGDPSQGNTWIFKNDKQYVFQNGKLNAERPVMHSLLILLYDVYMQPAETTIGKLEKLNYDLGKYHESSFEGRPIYVVGSHDKEAKENQFWVDKETMAVVREIKFNANGNKSEIDMKKFVKLGGSYMSTEIIFKNDGVIGLREEYYDYKIDRLIPDSMFDTENFKINK